MLRQMGKYITPNNLYSDIVGILTFDIKYNLGAIQLSTTCGTIIQLAIYFIFDLKGEGVYKYTQVL